jgi:hypothetical protein
MQKSKAKSVERSRRNQKPKIVMKQEHRFVADLYHYLVPFMNTRRPIYVSLDGEAAKRGVCEGLFSDSHVPDLWFYFSRSSEPVLVEAKIMNPDGSITINRGQLCAWRKKGKGKHKPIAWVASNGDLSEFYYWSHADFLEKLGRCKSGSKYPRIWPPKNGCSFADVRGLALHILRNLRPPA